MKLGVHVQLPDGTEMHAGTIEDIGIREKTGWALSPVFDVNPFSLGNRVDSTPVSEDDDPADRDIRHLISTADAYRLTRDDAIRIVREVDEATRNWRGVAQGFGLSTDTFPSRTRAFENLNRSRAQELDAPAAMPQYRSAGQYQPRRKDTGPSQQEPKHQSRRTSQ